MEGARPAGDAAKNFFRRVWRQVFRRGRERVGRKHDHVGCETRTFDRAQNERNAGCPVFSRPQRRDFRFGVPRIPGPGKNSERVVDGALDARFFAEILKLRFPAELSLAESPRNFSWAPGGARRYRIGRFGFRKTAERRRPSTEPVEHDGAAAENDQSVTRLAVPERCEDGARRAKQLGAMDEIAGADDTGRELLRREMRDVAPRLAREEPNFLGRQALRYRPASGQSENGLGRFALAGARQDFQRLPRDCGRAAQRRASFVFGCQDLCFFGCQGALVRAALRRRNALVCLDGFRGFHAFLSGTMDHSFAGDGFNFLLVRAGSRHATIPLAAWPFRALLNRSARGTYTCAMAANKETDKLPAPSGDGIPEGQTDDILLRLLGGVRELAVQVLRLLDPTSLAAIAAVSRYWRAVAKNLRGPTQAGFVLHISAVVARPALLEWAKSIEALPPPNGEKGVDLCTQAALLCPQPLESLAWLRANGYPWGPHTCAVAAAGGQLAVLRWLRDGGWPYEPGCPWDSETCNWAAGGGHFELLRWAQINGCPWTEKTFAIAARGGNLEMLQWMRANGCPWSVNACVSAAEGGHLRCLKWLRCAKTHGGDVCPWDPLVCERAARAGHLDVLVWARENGCPWDSGTCSAAAKHGRLPVLQWAIANWAPWGSSLYARAAKANQLEVLRWAFDNGCPLSEKAGRKAARLAAARGHVAVLEWLFARRPEVLDTELCAIAAGCGQLAALEWAFARGKPGAIGGRVCLAAAASGHLDVLCWACSNGCPWSADASTAAAYAGHLRVLDWGAANGCLALDEALFAAAAAGGHLGALEWAAAHHCPWDESACAFAAREGEFQSLRWLRAHGCPWNAMVCVYAAARGDLAMLGWARENNCEWNENTYRAAFYEGGREIAVWVASNGCPVPRELRGAHSALVGEEPSGSDDASGSDESSPLLEAVTALMRRSLTARIVLGSDSDGPDV